MLGIFPELLLSMVILVLVVYGLRGGIIKVSIVTLILGGLISLWLRAEIMSAVDYAANGLLLTSE